MIVMKVVLDCPDSYLDDDTINLESVLEDFRVPVRVNAVTNELSIDVAVMPPIISESLPQLLPKAVEDIHGVQQSLGSMGVRAESEKEDDDILVNLFLLLTHIFVPVLSLFCIQCGSKEICA